MRSVLVILGLVIMPMAMLAQNESNGVPISISYYGHYAFQPGIKVGTEISLEGRDNNVKNWFISPQLGFFANPGDKNNYVINLESGLRKPTSNKNRYHSYSIGMGYLIKSKLNSVSLNLGTGNTDGKRRVSTGHLLSTFNYEYGWNTHKPVQWYAKYSIGSTFSSGRESALVMFIEFGMKFRLKQKGTKNE